MCLSVCLSVRLFVAGVSWFGMLIGIVLEMWFQRLYRGNRVRWFRIWYCQQHVIKICCCLRPKRNKFHIIPETWFQRFFRGNRVSRFRIWYCQQHVVNICCCLGSKGNKFQYCPRNLVLRFLWVNRIRWFRIWHWQHHIMYICCKKVIPQISEVTFPQPRAEGRRPECGQKVSATCLARTCEARDSYC